MSMVAYIAGDSLGERDLSGGGVCVVADGVAVFEAMAPPEFGLAIRGELLAAVTAVEVASLRGLHHHTLTLAVGSREVLAALTAPHDPMPWKPHADIIVRARKLIRERSAVVKLAEGAAAVEGAARASRIAAAACRRDILPATPTKPAEAPAARPAKPAAPPLLSLVPELSPEEYQKALASYTHRVFGQDHAEAMKESVTMLSSLSVEELRAREADYLARHGLRPRADEPIAPTDPSPTDHDDHDEEEPHDDHAADE